MRLPKHIGIIPDGNRRWAVSQGIPKIKGWEKGIDPGYDLFKLMQKAGIEEVTYYGYTMENAKRPLAQRNAIINACINGVKILSREDAELLVVGNTNSRGFPKDLLPYTTGRKKFGKGGIKVNFLVNYGWEWDLTNLKTADHGPKGIIHYLKSCEISKIDLIIRWGGWSRLSGFLPVQSIYADIYIIDEFWPDFKPVHFNKALEWYSKQDITLGG
jgi:undecaprenyl diphosphate synthase